MIYVAEFILVLPVNLVIAWWHAWLIRQHKLILHWAWSALFIALVALATWWQWQAMPSVGRVVVFVIACLIGRLIVFNIALNRFRGLPWSYLGTASWTDKLERRLFGARIWLAEVALGIVFITLQFFL